MADRRQDIRTRNTLLLIVATALAGCAGVSGLITGRNTAEPAEPVILGAPEADAYLDDLRRLADGDPATQAEIYADAESAARLTPGPSTSLRYALVLATPGHAEQDAQQAQSLLREVLTQQAILTPSEIALATMHLAAVEERIVLSAEARRLREASSRADRTEERAVSQRLATVEAENRRLRRELAEAEEKLEAITSIERSIRDRDATP